MTAIAMTAKKNDRSYFSGSALWLTGTALRLLPTATAGRLAARMFRTPPAPQREGDVPAYTLRLVPHEGLKLAVYEWGTGQGPKVLLAHGWGGRAAQLAPLVKPLLEA